MKNSGPQEAFYKHSLHDSRYLIILPQSCPTKKQGKMVGRVGLIILGWEMVQFSFPSIPVLRRMKETTSTGQHHGLEQTNLYLYTMFHWEVKSSWFQRYILICIPLFIFVPQDTCLLGTQFCDRDDRNWTENSKVNKALEGARRVQCPPPSPTVQK